MREESTRENPARPLGFEEAERWLSETAGVMRRRKGMLIYAAALLLTCRWALGPLSYLTDALLLCGAGMAVRRETGLREALNSTFLKEARKGVWSSLLLALPAILASLIIFAALIPAALPSVYVSTSLVGLPLLGIGLFLSGYVCMLLSWAPFLAAMRATENKEEGFQSRTVWTYKALRAAWRPLLVVWTAFASTALLCALAGTWLTGVLARDSTMSAEAAEGLLFMSQWPVLFAAVMTLAALMPVVYASAKPRADADVADDEPLPKGYLFQSGLHGGISALLWIISFGLAATATVIDETLTLLVMAGVFGGLAEAFRRASKAWERADSSPSERWTAALVLGATVSGAITLAFLL